MIDKIPIVCPPIRNPKPGCTLRWTQINEAKDLPPFLFLGPLKGAVFNGNSWGAAYGEGSLELTLRCDGKTVRAQETFRGEDISTYSMSANEFVCDLARYRPHPSGEGERENAIEWRRDYGVHLLTSEHYREENILACSFPEGYQLTLALIMPFTRLPELANLYKKWSRERFFSISGFVDADQFLLSEPLGGELIIMKDVDRRMLESGYLPIIEREPRMEKIGKGRFLTMPIQGIQLTLTVLQSDVVAIARDLRNAGCLDPSDTSMQIAVAAYAPSSAALQNVTYRTRDGMKRIMLRRLEPEFEIQKVLLAQEPPCIDEFLYKIHLMEDEWSRAKSSIQSLINRSP